MEKGERVAELETVRRTFLLLQVDLFLMKEFGGQG